MTDPDDLLDSFDGSRTAQLLDEIMIEFYLIRRLNNVERIWMV